MRGSAQHHQVDAEVLRVLDDCRLCRTPKELRLRLESIDPESLSGLAKVVG
jgi:hypothetical protein